MVTSNLDFILKYTLNDRGTGSYLLNIRNWGNIRLICKQWLVILNERSNMFVKYRIKLVDRMIARKQIGVMKDVYLNCISKLKIKLEELIQSVATGEHANDLLVFSNTTNVTPTYLCKADYNLCEKGNNSIIIELLSFTWTNNKNILRGKINMFNLCL